MTSQKDTPKHPTVLGQILKEHRATYRQKQADLAAELSVEERTIRRWENGETIIQNTKELARIASLLGIDPERLGLAKTALIPLDTTRLQEMTAYTWNLISEARIQQARNVIEMLAQEIPPLLHQGDTDFFRAAAQAYHVCGYVISENTRSSGSPLSIMYYAKMEAIARQLNDPTLINIALTYQGDMYRRMKNLPRAQQYLEAARDTEGADTDSLGNGIQLLARVYRSLGETKAFDRAMYQSLDLSYQVTVDASSTRGHYTTGTVYEEWARHYAQSGLINQAMENIKKAEETLPQTYFWALLLETTQATALVHGGEIRAGVDVAIKTAEECQRLGIDRYLDRIYSIEQYLQQLTSKAMTAATALTDALRGGNLVDEI